MKEKTGRAALPECALVGNAAHPDETEVRYRGFKERLRMEKKESANE